MQIPHFEPFPRRAKIQPFKYQIDAFRCGQADGAIAMGKEPVIEGFRRLPLYMLFYQSEKAVEVLAAAAIASVLKVVPSLACGRRLLRGFIGGHRLRSLGHRLIGGKSRSEGGGRQ